MSSDHKSPKVSRKPQVCFAPYELAYGLRRKTNLISVGDKDSQYGYLVKHKRVFELKFDSGDELTTDTIDKLFEFIDECVKSNENIVVHCQYGRMRSAAIAKFIEKYFDYIFEPCPGWDHGFQTMDKFLLTQLEIRWLKSKTTRPAKA